MTFRIVTVIAIVALLAAGVQTLRLSSTREALRDTQDALAGQQRAIAALSAHVRGLQATAAHWRNVAAELETYEGHDEPLNPYERAVLDRVRNP